MRASSEDDFYKAGWWNGIDDPEAGLKGHAVAIDYRANGLDMTVFCTSITNKAHQTDDYRLATNAIYSKLLGTDFNVESGETPEPTPNPDTKPDTGKDTQSPETGDGIPLPYGSWQRPCLWPLCWCSPPRSVRIDLLPK